MMSSPGLGCCSETVKQNWWVIIFTCWIEHGISEAIQESASSCGAGAVYTRDLINFLHEINTC